MTKTKWAFSILLVLFSIFTVATIVPMPHATEPGPVLTLEPNWRFAGTTFHIDVTGSGFTSGPCTLGSEPPMADVTVACTNPSGDLTGSIDGGPSALPGTYVFFVTQEPLVASASLTLYSSVTVTATTTIWSTAQSTTTGTATSTVIVTATTTPTTQTVTANTTVSTPHITATPSYALAGSSGTVTITGANFAGTYITIDTGSVLSGAAAGPISSGSFTIALSVNPLASVGSYTLVAHGNGGSADSASCPFVILPSTTVTSTVYSPTVTSISTSISKTTRSTTVTEISTSYIATTTGGTYTSYLYTWTYPGYTTLTIPTATVTIYGVSVQTIYTGVMTETQQYTVTVSQQNVATVGGGTTTLWSTQTLPTTAMQTVINGTTSVFVTESNYVEQSITVQTVTQTVNPPTTQPSPEIPFWLIIAIILTGVGGGAVGLFFVLRRGGVLSRLRPKPELEEEPEPTPVPKLDTDAKPETGTETVAQPAPAQVSPSGKVMCGGCGAENLAAATSCELCGLPLTPRTTAESEDAMGKVGTGEGGAWHT